MSLEQEVQKLNETIAHATAIIAAGIAALGGAAVAPAAAVATTPAKPTPTKPAAPAAVATTKPAPAKAAPAATNKAPTYEDAKAVLMAMSKNPALGRQSVVDLLAKFQQLSGDPATLLPEVQPKDFADFIRQGNELLAQHPTQAAA